MGLDMYLIRKRDIGKAKIKVEILDNEYNWYNNINKEYIIENATDIVEEVGYWRKANAIHKWFVDNVQDGNDDCREYFVDYKKIQELLNICKEIKEKVILEKGKITNGYQGTKNGFEPIIEDGNIIKNTEICEELLPTQSGFFFGDTDYDEYYMEDIENTINIIEKVLKENTGDIYYISSW